MAVVELLLSFTLLVFLWIFWNKKPSRYPATPPFRLPLLGHAHLVARSKNVYDGVHDVYKKYGKDSGMIAMNMAGQDMVFVYDLDLIKRVLKSEEVNFRSDSWEFIENNSQMWRGTKEGIVMSCGRTWREQRRFLMRNLKDLGLFGKTDVATIINEELDHFIRHLEAKTGHLQVNHSLFNLSVINIFWRILAGERKHHDDPQMTQLADRVVSAMESLGPNPITLLFVKYRFLQKLLPFIDPVRRIRSIWAELEHFLDDTVAEHRGKLDPDNPKDFIDLYLLEMEKQRDDPTSSFSGKAGDINIVQCLMDLFCAGSETTSSSLSWAVLFLVRHPEVQTRFRSEVLRVIGPSAVPRLSDRDSMPFTNAVIAEVQRLGNVVPFGLQRATFQGPFELGGCVIPRKHLIECDLGRIMTSERYFPDPFAFNPDRHLIDGAFVRSEYLIPFSFGKRQCPGESLGKADLFLFLTRMVRKFEFKAENAEDLPTLDPVCGLTMAPKSFRVVMNKVE